MRVNSVTKNFRKSQTIVAKFKRVKTTCSCTDVYRLQLCIFRFEAPTFGGRLTQTTSILTNKRLLHRVRVYRPTVLQHSSTGRLI